MQITFTKLVDIATIHHGAVRSVRSLVWIIVGARQGNSDAIITGGLPCVFVTNPQIVVAMLVFTPKHGQRPPHVVAFFPNFISQIAPHHSRRNHHHRWARHVALIDAPCMLVFHHDLLPFIIGMEFMTITNNGPGQ
jgi:hypothetical protein